MEDYMYDIDYLSDDIYGDDYGDMFYDVTYYTLYDLWKDCLIPTLHDGFSSCVKILGYCFLLKFVLLFEFSWNYVFHLTSALFGVVCLYSFFGTEGIFYILLFAAFGIVILFITHDILNQNQGYFCAFLCFSFLISCELLFTDRKLWHRIRGCQMLLCMKLISLAFDTSQADKVLPPVAHCMGFLFHPGTVIFGPWISYSSYINSQLDTRISLSWFFSIIRSLLISFAFLTLSTCWTSWLFFTDEFIWVNAYRDALSFRSSHYFISYLSEATAISSGLRISAVAAAFEVEIPRSLVEVVVWWNVPMHFWLKTYVFKTTKRFGDFAAVLCTYASSSILHGLNFQLAAVLLSLGFYTYIEHVLRKRLANIFKACILARRCKPECEHEFKFDNLYVRITNIGFGLLAMFHLAYLGVMFDSSSQLEEEGYNMSHTLSKWSELSFASHWVALSSYIFYYIT